MPAVEAHQINTVFFRLRTMLVDAKLRAISFMVLNRMDSTGVLVALDVIEDKAGDFKSPDNFKAVLDLPEQCSVIDVTGWNLMP